MSESKLFLGFPLNDAFVFELKKIPLVERDLFIQQNNALYLQEIESDSIVYLGKPLGSEVKLDELEGACSHIISLLKKIVPHFNEDTQAFVLLTMDER